MSQFLKYLLLKAYPRILGKSFEYSIETRLSYIDTTTMNLDNRTRIDPWAFIRVKNEEITMMESLNSITPIISRGIIAYNDCSDHSEEFILEFCKKHPGFTPFRYPYPVVPAHSDITNIPYVNTLACYYNAALAFIPQNVWMVKIDLDQIYIPEIFEQSFYLPRNTFESVSYSRLDLIRKGNEFRVIKYRRPHDHLLIFNKNIAFRNNINIVDGRKCYVEGLNIKTRTAHYQPPCSSIHFPYEKQYRQPPKELWDNAIPFEKFINTSRHRKEIPQQLNKEFIEQTFSKFYLEPK